MSTLDLLRQKSGELATQIETAEEPQLRRLSSTLADAAVKRSGLSHPLITEALRHLSDSTHPHRELQVQVQALADQLDEEYFDLKEPYEERPDAGKTEPSVIAAFAKARAASAVACALGDVTRAAAARTAYEALAAIDDSEYLTGIARSVLAQ